MSILNKIKSLFVKDEKQSNLPVGIVAGTRMVDADTGFEYVYDGSQWSPVNRDQAVNNTRAAKPYVSPFASNVSSRPTPPITPIRSSQRYESSNNNNDDFLTQAAVLSSLSSSSCDSGSSSWSSSSYDSGSSYSSCDSSSSSWGCD